MKLKLQLLFIALMTTFSLSLLAQNTVSGTITDADTGEGLIGANILIQGSTIGTTTDFDGNFTLTSDRAFPWNLDISYTGFSDQSLQITENTSNLSVSMSSGITFEDDIVISASRKPEKVTESVASVSVLSSARIESKPTTGDPLSLLKDIQGVHLVHNNVVKANINLRGQVKANETNTLVLKDYRIINSPYTTILDSERTPINSLDIEKVEVVRGPSGALWGPGVNSGIVHFISKDPFRHPGTGISASRSVEGQGINQIDFRHAGSSDKFGYKILYTHKSGDDFIYDLEDPTDMANAMATINAAGPPFLRNGAFDDLNGNAIPLFSETNANGDQQFNLTPDFHSNSFEATLEFKPTDDLKLALVQHFAEGEVNFRNANLHLREKGITINTQARVNYKQFFASVNFLNSPGWEGDFGTNSGYYVGEYITTAVASQGSIRNVDIATQLPFSAGENLDFVTGIDAKIFRFNGSPAEGINSRHGRYEDDDDFNVIGAYLQATYKVSDKFKINAVGRFDDYSIYGSAFSPRVGFVYNPDADKNTAFRASINRSFRSPSIIISNFDTRLGPRYVLGSRSNISFNNPFINWGADKNTITPSLQSILAAVTPNLSEADQAAVAGAALSGNASSTLIDPFLGVPISAATDLNVVPSKLESATSFEVGYSGKGANNKLTYTLDFFYQIQENMQLSFTDVGPLVALGNLGGELGSALSGAGITGATADNVIAAAAAAFGGPNRMVSDQHQETGTFTARSAGFRNYDGKAKMFGLDAGFQYVTESGFSPFFNFSWLNDVVFDTEELGERPETGRMYWLNTPPTRIRFGVNKILTSDTGFYGSISGRYNKGFFAKQGGWEGDLPDYFLVDASVGYQLSNGLSVGLNATNLTDVVYRSFPRIPAQRRLVFVNLKYNFKHNTLSK